MTEQARSKKRPRPEDQTDTSLDQNPTAGPKPKEQKLVGKQILQPADFFNIVLSVASTTQTVVADEKTTVKAKTTAIATAKVRMLIESTKRKLIESLLNENPSIRTDESYCMGYFPAFHDSAHITEIAAFYGDKILLTFFKENCPEFMTETNKFKMRDAAMAGGQTAVMTELGFTLTEDQLTQEQEDDTLPSPARLASKTLSKLLQTAGSGITKAETVSEPASPTPSAAYNTY